MQSIRIEDIVPQGAKFKLRSTGRSYKINALSLADEIWINEEFGKGLEDIFKQVKMKEICRIIFRLMDEGDKEEFAAQDVTIMNEQGEKITKRLGGSELLFLMISGFQEKIDIFQALLQTIGVSRPLMDKLSEEEKKNEPVSPQTGLPPLTFSRASTGGRRNTSSRARPAKSRSGSSRSKSART